MDIRGPGELQGNFDIGYISETGFKSYGMHRHKYCELLFVMEGDLNFLVEDKVYHYSGSCMIFFRENRLHTTEVSANVNYERYNLYFRQKYISELVPFELIRDVYDNDCVVIPLSKEELGTMKGFFEHMYDLNKNPEKSPVESNLMIHLLCCVLLKTAMLVKEKFNPGSFNVNSYISDVITYINANLTSKLIIEEIAEYFFVSRAKLIKDFKRTAGVTVGDYILSRRIKLAKEMIRTGAKVSEVAELSGFTNTCHFIRTFKKVTGITPLQYRNAPK